ncbi:hypothetical protein PIB30_010602 [Stylosanthes scabra]|uniref:RRM domain-containing protein n=1 Tax=Stylosanthes scabra TaxID=79078 RepID=A0ABU6T7E2_9FABA|nr:hypothetical protein [Stylosanthes scabra]
MHHRVNIQWLWEVFSSIGQVVDVYISRKHRINNPNCFAFVRFGLKNHSLRAIESLNGSWLDGRKIVVSETKYARSGKVDKLDKSNQNNMEDAETHHNVEKDKHPARNFVRSFKNVLIGEKMEEENEGENEDFGTKDVAAQVIVKGSIDAEMKEKLNRSIVGESVIPLKSSIIPIILKDWDTLIEIKRLGTFKMVLTFDSVDNKKEALNSSLLLSYFGEVRDCSECEANRSRIAHIEMFGIPLQAWSSDNFRNVAEVWVTVISLDEGSFMGDNYNSVKATIDTNWLKPINDAAFLEVFAREITAMEDMTKDKRLILGINNGSDPILEGNHEITNLIHHANNNIEKESSTYPTIPPGFEDACLDKEWPHISGQKEDDHYLQIQSEGKLLVKVKKKKRKVRNKKESAAKNPLVIDERNTKRKETNEKKMTTKKDNTKKKKSEKARSTKYATGTEYDEKGFSDEIDEDSENEAIKTWSLGKALGLKNDNDEEVIKTLRKEGEESEFIKDMFITRRRRGAKKPNKKNNSTHEDQV